MKKNLADMTATTHAINESQKAFFLLKECRLAGGDFHRLESRPKSF